MRSVKLQYRHCASFLLCDSVAVGNVKNGAGLIFCVQKIV